MQFTWQVVNRRPPLHGGKASTCHVTKKARTAWKTWLSHDGSVTTQYISQEDACRNPFFASPHAENARFIVP